jgi:two-component system NarL family response regulator
MRIMIVEDDPLVRGNLALLIGGEPGFGVCGSFGTAEEGLAALDGAAPDILIADIGLPGMSGIELIRAVKGQRPGLDIVAFTVFDDRETVFSALKAGATGYMLKGTSPRQIIGAIQNVAEGGAPMSPKIARAVIREFHQPDLTEPYLLTPRETEILKLLERGYSYKVIADRCGISPHTVNSHIKKIYDKLHAKDRCCALLNARRRGII